MAQKKADITEDTARQKQNFNALLELVGAKQDRKAFSSLFEYFAPRLKSFLMNGGLPGEKAEEIMQDTFVTIWQKASGYDSQKAAASTWIFTIARNKKIDLLRKEKRHKIDPTEYLEFLPEPKKQSDTLQAKDNVEIIKDILNNLPKKQSELIIKSYYEHKTHLEISEEMQIPLGTVKSRLRLAIDKLRRAIEQEGIKSLEEIES